MKCSTLYSALALGAIACTLPSAASASPRDACSILTIAEVRTIVAAPVDRWAPGSNKPTVRGTTTFSNCTYLMQGYLGRGVRVMLLWGPAPLLSANYAAYVKRNRELPRLIGDALLVVSVTNAARGSGLTYDMPASRALLDAVARKL